MYDRICKKNQLTIFIRKMASRSSGSLSLGTGLHLWEGILRKLCSDTEQTWPQEREKCLKQKKHSEQPTSCAAFQKDGSWGM